MGRHIAFLNVPAIGHVYPTLAVAAELVRRGHRVSYATTQARAEVVAAAGATLRPYRSTRPADSDPNVAPLSRDDYISQSILNFMIEAQATFPQIERAFADDRPDLVVHDRMSFAGRSFAAKYAIPSVQTWAILVSNEIWNMGEELKAFDPEHPSFLAYLEKLDTFLTANDVPVDPAEFLDPKPNRHLLFFPRSLQLRGELFDDRFCFVGASIRRAPADSTWRPPTDGQPVVLVSLGTVHNRRPQFFRTCLAAFADTPWHVMMAVGERIDPDELGPAPPNADVRQVVPQLEVLAHAAVLLNHAGMGGIMEAISANVPLVTFPQTLEQEVNADRLVELRLGARLSAVPEPGEILAAVSTVAADPEIAERVEWMRRESVAAGGPVRAADIIEECLA